MTAAKPLPSSREPAPAAYADWCRASYPGVTDGAVREMWRWQPPAKYEFWTETGRRMEGASPELAAVTAERNAFRRRAEAAEAKVAEARDGIGKFLAQCGGSEIPVFKIAIDLASSTLKILAGKESGND